jgi:hypothetical protein
MKKSGNKGSGGSRLKRTGIIESGIGDDYFTNTYKGKPWIHCLIELIKNSRDSGANNIQLDTSNPLILQIVDNGKGMNKPGKSAFISVARSMKQGSAMFGTGAKMLIFSHSVEFIVRTVTQEDSETVCTFRCTTEKLDELLSTHGKLDEEYEEKTTKNWPYPFPTGTEITFQLREPKRPCITRGDELASELATRLPMKFRHIVRVDGNMLPEKSIVGEIFDLKVNHPQLGNISLEIYRPSDARKETDKLLFGSGEVGEVPALNLRQSLDATLRSRLPPIYTLNLVCGFVSIPYLRKYANEDRDSIDPNVTSDPMTPFLIDLLRAIEPQVKKCLKLESKGDPGESERALQEIHDLLQQVYGMDIKAREPTTLPLDEDEQAGPKPPSPFRLQLSRREFAVGEEINVVLDVDESVRKSYDLTNVTWSPFTDAHFKDIRKTGRGLRLIAAKPGRCTITADLRGSPYDANAHVLIVDRRRIHFAQSHVVVTQGTSVTLMLRNTDTLKGEVLLNSTGNNTYRLAPEGDRAIFNAGTPETATMTAMDSKDSSHRTTCEVEVIPPQDKVLIIRGEKFQLTGYSGLCSPETEPAIIERGNEVHSLYINLQNRHAVTASTYGDGRTFTVMAIGYEVARFLMLKECEEEGDCDTETFAKSVNQLALEITAEILQGKKSKQ